MDNPLVATRLSRLTLNNAENVRNVFSLAEISIYCLGKVAPPTGDQLTKLGLVIRLLILVWNLFFGTILVQLSGRPLTGNLSKWQLFAKTLHWDAERLILSKIKTWAGIKLGYPKCLIVDPGRFDNPSLSQNTLVYTHRGGQNYNSCLHDSRSCLTEDSLVRPKE